MRQGDARHALGFRKPVGWIGYPDAIEVTCKLLKARNVGYRGLAEMKAEALSTSHQLPVAYKKLRDYQKTGVDFLVARGTSGALLADDLGCGKSVQAVRAIRAFRKKAVIVCLSQAVGVWAGNDYMESQVEKWWPLVEREGSMLRLEGTSLPTHEWRVWQKDRVVPASGSEGVSLRIDGKKLQQRTVNQLNALWGDGITDESTLTCYEWRCSHCGARKSYGPESPSDGGCSAGLPRPSTRIVVVHYDILSHWVDYLLNVWGATTCVFDELHEVVGDRAIRTKAVTELARGGDVRIGLTGTPMANRPKSLYRTVDILSPGRFGEKPFVYYMRHCAGFQKQVSLTRVVYDFSGTPRRRSSTAVSGISCCDGRKPRSRLTCRRSSARSSTSRSPRRHASTSTFPFSNDQASRGKPSHYPRTRSSRRSLKRSRRTSARARKWCLLSPQARRGAHRGRHPGGRNEIYGRQRGRRTKRTRSANCRLQKRRGRLRSRLHARHMQRRGLTPGSRTLRATPS